MKKPIQSRIEFILFIGLYYIIKPLPLKIIKNIAAWLFEFGGMYLNIRRKVADDNLKMVFPEKSRKQRSEIMHKMYRYMGMSAAEIYFGNFDRMSQDVRIHGWEHLQEAVLMNRGVILATPHTGNWDLGGRFINQFFKVSVIIKKLRNRYLDDFTYCPKQFGDIVLIDYKNAVRKTIQLLKENYIVAIMIDQNARKNGVQTNFLGHPASTFSGMAKIAIKLQVPIVPALALRTEEHDNLFIFEEMIMPTGFQSNTEDIIRLTEQVSKKLEKHILEKPEQWFWVHKRWAGFHKAKKN